MNFDFYPLRKGNLLLLFAILLYQCLTSIPFVNAGGRGTNIVLTKDTIVLNDRQKKHSNNIVIKDEHKNHHCDCHEHHHYMPVHHYGQHWGHHWDHHHKRSDSAALNWWDGMQMAASTQHDQHTLPGYLNSNPHYAQPPFIQGKDNEALNSIVKQRYLSPVRFNLGSLTDKISLPVFVRNS